ncbi:MAG: hypothetical protein HY951_09240 [Bacteroidia bacterium]|nr:hypothetical protein [Bacteroidia bacterium]
MKYWILIFVLFFCVHVFGQTTKDLIKELTENKFVTVNKKDIPLELIKTLGYDSYDQIGTRKTQTGCTSGKRIVINWLATNNDGLYVMSISTCGAYSDTNYFIVTGKTKYKISIEGYFNNFNQFKKAYLHVNS